MEQQHQLLFPFSKEVPSIVHNVHCFFHRCRHVTRSTDPYEAGRLMEQHYKEKHEQDIKRIVARL